ncbi:cytochrome c [Alsobacter sp. SYSU M60028]|uniref:Cytochrome c n=1 Tax=Alsobacter ponti TaxID=2962936 RepID=A0ABT1L875_9HYPH|nr:cytochrome c [Alsobacter ponti]MCP8936920.1 cytochrome c [Alsobacter ponti]
MGSKTTRGETRGKTARALALAGLTALAATAALAQSGPATLPDDRRDDVIQARQLLMDAIEEQVAPVDLAAAGAKADLQAVKDRAYLINTLLSAFPHLFPPGTRPSDVPDGGVTTNATPALWDKFDAFYQLSRTAASEALEASQAGDASAFATHATALRKACDACHADYMVIQSNPGAPQK